MLLESFRRWQAESIAQKQRASALILALAGAALGFSVSQLDKEKQYIGCHLSLFFNIQAIAQLVSISAGVLFSLNRVRDFDLTSQIARVRETNPVSSRLGLMRKTVRKFGRITRKLYLVQILAFIFGAICFVAFEFIKYEKILYASQ
jgi:hypothetical protein